MCNFRFWILRSDPCPYGNRTGRCPEDEARAEHKEERMEEEAEEGAREGKPAFSRSCCSRPSNRTNTPENQKSGGGPYMSLLVHGSID